MSNCKKDLPVKINRCRKLPWALLVDQEPIPVTESKKKTIMFGSFSLILMPALLLCAHFTPFAFEQSERFLFFAGRAEHLVMKKYLKGGGLEGAKF